MDNSINRYGSSDFCTEDEIAAAGYFRRTPDSVLIGFLGSRALWSATLGGLLVQAGARSGKFRDWLGYLACGIGCEDHNMVVLDVKGEFCTVGRGS
jgi:type IV secretion system protein VirD4